VGRLVAGVLVVGITGIDGVVCVVFVMAEVCVVFDGPKGATEDVEVELVARAAGVAGIAKVGGGITCVIGAETNGIAVVVVEVVI